MLHSKAPSFASFPDLPQTSLAVQPSTEPSPTFSSFPAHVESLVEDCHSPLSPLSQQYNKRRKRDDGGERGGREERDSRRRKEERRRKDRDRASALVRGETRKIEDERQSSSKREKSPGRAERGTELDDGVPWYEVSGERIRPSYVELDTVSPCKLPLPSGRRQSWLIDDHGIAEHERDILLGHRWRQGCHQVRQFFLA